MTRHIHDPSISPVYITDAQEDIEYTHVCSIINAASVCVYFP